MKHKAKLRILPSRSDAQAGYTLMELLVVLSILGFLAVIATPQVLKYLDSAKISTARTEIANLSASLDLFRFDTGRYPTTEEGLDALLAAPVAMPSWRGPYLNQTTNLSDPWQNPYHYRSPGENGEFDLFTYGPNAAEETIGEPLVANW
jgi:general secretion pathway protein G